MGVTDGAIPFSSNLLESVFLPISRSPGTFCVVYDRVKKFPSMTFRLVAAGDNARRKVLQDIIAASPTFCDCVTQPYFDPGDVAQIAGDDILAVLLRSGDLYIAEKTIQKLPFLLLSIRVAESTVYAIDQDYHLRVIGSADRAPFQNERILPTKGSEDRSSCHGASSIVRKT
jgi:hypothetical protein